MHFPFSKQAHLQSVSIPPPGKRISCKALKPEQNYVVLYSSSQLLPVNNERAFLWDFFARKNSICETHSTRASEIICCWKYSRYDTFVYKYFRGFFSWHSFSVQLNCNVVWQQFEVRSHFLLYSQIEFSSVHLFPLSKSLTNMTMQATSKKAIKIPLLWDIW